MKQFNSQKNRSGLMGVAILSMAAMFGITSCKPDFDLDKRMPEWLGPSIYETLSDGFEGYEFKTYVRLIDDLNQKDILAKTGSKTLFVADDSAFARFFQNCPFKKHVLGTGGQDTLVPVTCYEELSYAQKTMILKGSMLNNVYQVAMLSSSEGPTLGDCMRRLSSASPYDSVRVLPLDKLPNGPSWDYLRNDPNKTGVVVMQDGTVKPMVFFVNKFLTMKRITDDDYDFLFNKGRWPLKNPKNADAREPNEASVNGVKIEFQNKKCFNGFLHVMADVVYLLPSMAEYLEQSDEAQIYSAILERFSAPFYQSPLEKQRMQNNTDEMSNSGHIKDLISKGKLGSAELVNALSSSNDTVFTKMYFSERAQVNGETPVQKDQFGKKVGDGEMLRFDPGWNEFFSKTSMTSTTQNVALQQNMAVMLVPTDEAITKWWLKEAGSALREKFGHDDFKGEGKEPKNVQEVIKDMSGVPRNVIVKLVNNNMLNSLVATVPSKFANVLNDANDPMFDDPEDAKKEIKNVVMCCNGAIYFTTAVYAPTAYRSVSYPALINAKLKIFNWAIEDKELSFSAYLNSMVSTYSFFVPKVNEGTNTDLDDALVWVDPCSFALKKKGSGVEDATLFALAFKYNTTDQTVIADVYQYDDTTNTLGKKTATTITDAAIIRNRLRDMLDYHIIIGDVESNSFADDDQYGGYSYFQTKGRGTIRFSSKGVVDPEIHFANFKVQGGWQVENNEDITIEKRYDLSKQSKSKGNGRTYIIDKPLMTSRNSVYDILSDSVNYPEFQTFYKLMVGVTGSDDGKEKSLFASTSNKNMIGSQNCVTTFNTYHYTLYVPTNESVQKLIDNGIVPTPSQISNINKHYSDLKKSLEATYAKVKADSIFRDTMIALSKKLRNADPSEEPTEADLSFSYTVYTNQLKARLKNFVRYHIQDNSVYCNAEFNAGYDAKGNPAETAGYETAYMNDNQQFVKVYVKGGNEVSVTDVKGNVRKVQKHKFSGNNETSGAPLWNIMCREFEFTSDNGTAGSTFTTVDKALIETSSYVVVHQIDRPLCNGETIFDEDIFR